MKNLTEIQKDVLTEAINMSIGKAAATFNTMLKEHITLSVPDIQITKGEEILSLLGIDQEQEVCFVHQHFTGSYFVSDAMLVFAKDESLELVEIFLGKNMVSDELNTLEIEAMTEIGNIILNACVGSLANLLEDEIEGSLPNCKKCTAKNVFKPSEIPELFMLIFIDFGVESKNIKGYVVLILEVKSFDTFIDRLLAKFT